MGREVDHMRAIAARDATRYGRTVMLIVAPVVLVASTIIPTLT